MENKSNGNTSDRVANDLQKQKEDKPVSGLQLFNRAMTSSDTQSYLRSVLGNRAGSFVNNLVALVANSAQLQQCQPYTIMFAALKATALNLPLDPSLGMAYVIPFKNNKLGVVEAQFQIGAKGFKELALRTCRFKRINYTDVREGEFVRRNRLTGDVEFNFEQDDERRLSLPVIGYVSYFSLVDGFESTLYMSKAEVFAHGKRYSQTFRSTDERVRNASRWTTDFDDMALKTVLKLNLSRNAPKSVEMQEALKADQAVMRSEDSYEYEYVDNRQGDDDVVIGVSDEKAQSVADKFRDFQDFGTKNKKEEVK